MFLNLSLIEFGHQKNWCVPICGILLIWNSNNPLNCNLFVIPLHFKGIRVLLGSTLENCDLIALQPNLLWLPESITACALYNEIERFKKNIFPIPHSLDGSCHILIGHCLDGVIWGDLNSETKAKTKLDNFEGHFSFVGYQKRNQCKHRFRVGMYKVSQDWVQWCYLSTLWCNPTGFARWCNVNKQVNGSRKEQNGVNLISCTSLSQWDFCESRGRSMCDLCECRHVTWAVEQCAVICTKKALFLFWSTKKTRTGLSFNCKGFKHESSLPSSPRFSCRCAHRL